MTTIAGLLPNDDHLTHAVEMLADTGVPHDHLMVLTQPAEVWQQLHGRRRMHIVFRDGAIGAALGLVVGLLYALPAGYFDYLMDFPLSTSLILGVLIVAYWTAGGALLGAIVGLNRLEQPLYSYMHEVRRGAALLLVDTTDERAQEVADILTREAGAVVEQISEDI